MALSRYAIELKKKGELYLAIKAFPGAGKTEVKGIMDDGTVKINLKAPADKGKANQELVRFLASEFGVGRDGVAIISGWTSRAKLVKINQE